MELEPWKPENPAAAGDCRVPRLCAKGEMRGISFRSIAEYLILGQASNIRGSSLAKGALVGTVYDIARFVDRVYWGRRDGRGDDRESASAAAR